jgi:hypothetical protein
MNPRGHSKKRRAEQKADSQPPQDTWLAAKGSLAAVTGAFLIFFFCNGCIALVRHYIVVATASNYEDRELEIRSYRHGPNETSEDPLRIKGILHPEGIEVHTDDNSVSLMRLNNSNFPIQMAPAEEKVVGKRIAVKYYVGNMEDHRWWHPSTIHNQFMFNTSGLIRLWVSTSAYLAAMLFCCKYAYHANQKTDQDKAAE